MQFQRLTVTPQKFYELLVAPHFADLTPDGPYTGTLNEFTVMDDVSSKRTIIDILGRGNILKRRDASCNIQFTPVAKARLGQIETDPIYGATLQCDNEFYQGCLEDFRNSDPKFVDYILDFFLKAIKQDLNSNAYFGDVERPDDPNGFWSWNVFDGIFKKIALHIANGLIPAGQTFSIPAGSMSGASGPQNGFNALQECVDRQDVLLKALPAGMKAIYTDDAIFTAYKKFLRGQGGAFDITLYSNGVGIPKFDDIDVLPDPTWGPILTALNGGTAAYAAILTIRGNFVFATDKTYGERTDQGLKSLMVWYSWDDLVWKYAMFMRAGTEIAYPPHLVIGMTSIA